MKNKCPHKPPKAPKSLYGTRLKRLLGIVSPSREMLALVNGTERQYFRDKEAYYWKVIRWKISQRTCNRTEWNRYRKYKFFLRRRRR